MSDFAGVQEEHEVRCHAVFWEVLIDERHTVF